MPPCCQTGVLTPADDQVLEQSYVQETQGLLQTLGDFAICFAGLLIARRVIVKNDDSGGVEFQGTLGGAPGMNLAAVDLA